VSVAFTHQVADGLHAAVVKAVKPCDAKPAVAGAARALPLADHRGCCWPAAFACLDAGS
jgi:hypothetical protein